MQYQYAPLTGVYKPDLKEFFSLDKSRGSNHLVKNGQNRRPQQSHLTPAPFLITHPFQLFGGRFAWFHPSQITSPPPSPPGTTSITFSNPPVVHDLILCNTFSIIKYSGNGIGEQFRL